MTTSNYAAKYYNYSVSTTQANLHIFNRDTVMHLLREMDPEGVDARQARRLRRRVYKSKGPNYLVHIDGYDKLKPYGFAIHGAHCK